MNHFRKVLTKERLTALFGAGVSTSIGLAILYAIEHVNDPFFQKETIVLGLAFMVFGVGCSCVVALTWGKQQ